MTTLTPALEPDRAARNGTRWYERAVIYELHVRAFRDSDGNGAGDFTGLLSKLDYIQELGVTALWLLPFCPSPWRDDGYDVSDFVGIHPAYGCLDDFNRFVAECKRRDLRVITELVLNHTSTEHPWFERARSSPPGSRWRDFYVWSDTPDRFSGVRIIFKDFEASNWTWDPVAGAYYWHRFYSHQPDLNFDNPDVRQAVYETVDFWLSLGVDGLRLDAVPYLFEREGTICENLPETHAFLRDLRAHIDSRYQDRMLLAEANQWPEDAIAYFGASDECHMAFNFPLMPRLFMATRMEDSFPITNIVQRTPAPPDGCQWATFLRNHDELTLEMVCDEERDYLYRTYAQDPEMRINLGIRRRLAPLLNNDHARIKLMNALLFSLPGTPVIYYGDEIGMGEDLSLGDRNSVRTPMQWSAERNAGFSDAESDQLYLPVVSSGEYANDVVNVESQLKDPNSLLWWMRHVLAVRRHSDALTAGEIEFLSHSNRHVLVFLRKHERGDVLVIANLSRHAQPVRLPLATYTGRSPVEAFGRVEFPPIGADPYQLSVAPYGFYWFHLPVADSASVDHAEPVDLERLDWQNRDVLSKLLKPYLHSEDVSKPRQITSVEVIDLATFSDTSAIAVVRMSFAAGDPELRLLPLTIESNADLIAPELIIARLRGDSAEHPALCRYAASGPMSDALFALIAGNGELTTQAGKLRGFCLPSLASGAYDNPVCLLPNSPRDGQRNASALLSNVFALKLFRRLEPGPNPDISTVRFLFEEAGFNHIAPVFGWVEYEDAGAEAYAAGVLHAFVENRTDLWQLTVDELSLYLERAATKRDGHAETASPELIDGYLQVMRVLGNRTAQMHRALMGPAESEFSPEPFDAFSLRGLYHSMSSMAAGVAQAVQLHRVSEEEKALEDATEVLDRLAHIDQVFGKLLTIQEPGLRIRAHGDFHLGQVLYTGSDLVFIDFEGDSSRPVFERLIKTSPLVDVAAVLFSARYAAISTLFGLSGGSLRWHGHAAELKAVISEWYEAVASAFSAEYLRSVNGSELLPADPDELQSLLHIYIVSKAVYQLGYELAHRPQWLPVAMRTFLTVTGD